MKKIKVKFLDDSEFWFHNTAFGKIINEHYELEITDDPDYIFCNSYGKPYEYCQYPQIRIMISGENFIPDFNLVDYSMSVYPIQFLDRHLQFSPIIIELEKMAKFKNMDRNYNRDILDKKNHFANFIASHESEHNIRGDFFKELSKYKRVESVGTYLNNMPNGETVNLSMNSKIKFQEKCKFTLCFESSKHQGFVTEKISDAFLSNTIPVYYGSDTVTEIFNSNAFINCNEYPSFDDVIERIKELDNDDDKYLEMLRQPVFSDSEYLDKKYKEAEGFICNIFDQPLMDAYRRSKVGLPRTYDIRLNSLFNKHTSQKGIRSRLKKIINKLV